MKYDLRDTTFILAVRLDSMQRLENVWAVTTQLCRYFDTHVIVAEIDGQCNGVLKAILPKRVTYLFIEDKDQVFHRTMYFNRITAGIETPIVALWDADVVIDKRAILDATEQIRTKQADVAYPYNGVFLETSEIIRRFYLKTKDIRVLYRNRNKLDYLYNRPMAGGAVFVDRQKYVDAGMENELHYGWGNDDFDRYYRFEALGYKIHRTDVPLFHLRHPRGDNSRFRSGLFEQLSSCERVKVENSSAEEIIRYNDRI